MATRPLVKWWIRENGLKSGPFSEDELYDALKNKDPSSVKVWRLGATSWVTVDKIPPRPEPVTPRDGPDHSIEVKSPESKLSAETIKIRRRHPGLVRAILLPCLTLAAIAGGVGLSLLLHQDE